MINTPANGPWQLDVAFTPIGGGSPNITSLTFLPDGSIDRTQTQIGGIYNLNRVLGSVFDNLRTQTNQNFDFWTLINWIFVSRYWTVLSDLGQVSPTISDGTGNATPFFATNNIFVNHTLFNIYSSYLQNAIIPALDPDFSFPTFSDLTSDNSLNAQTTTFIRSYSCLERRLKSPISLIIGIIVANYSFIMGGYGIVLLIATWVDRHRPDREPLLGEIIINRELLRGMYEEG